MRPVCFFTMPITPTEKIWFNGKFIPWDDAKVHVMTHALHYGTSWFEGIRAYKTKKGTAVFRLHEHIVRLANSTKIYRTEIPFSIDAIEKAIVETVRINKQEHCYIRPLVFRGYGEMGVYPVLAPVDVMIAVYPLEHYFLGISEKGMDVCVSSWRRAAPDTFPTVAKAGGNYISTALIRMEAVAAGFNDGIALDVNGYVSEGSAANVFLVIDGELLTPPLSASILPGITRDSIINLARDMNMKVREENIPREMLYIADEVFLCGTAAEVAPIATIDKITIGDGTVGSVTKKLRAKFYDVIESGTDPHGWLTFV